MAIAESRSFEIPAFNEDERKFLRAWLVSYIELELGRPPSRRAEPHIVDMMERRVPVDTFGMRTFLKWKSIPTKTTSQRNDRPQSAEEPRVLPSWLQPGASLTPEERQEALKRYREKQNRTQIPDHEEGHPRTEFGSREAYRRDRGSFRGPYS